MHPIFPRLQQLFAATALACLVAAPAMHSPLSHWLGTGCGCRTTSAGQNESQTGAAAPSSGCCHHYHHAVHTSGDAKVACHHDAPENRGDDSSQHGPDDCSVCQLLAQSVNVVAIVAPLGMVEPAFYAAPAPVSLLSRLITGELHLRGPPLVA